MSLDNKDHSRAKPFCSIPTPLPSTPLGTPSCQLKPVLQPSHPGQLDRLPQKRSVKVLTMVQVEIKVQRKGESCCWAARTDSDKEQVPPPSTILEHCYTT